MFKGIEGLRAWLAWTVVFAHLVEVSGLETLIPKAKIFDEAGDDAVLVFIIISGFVITHLIVEKKESFPTFITRRFLRIYPAYLLALLLAIATSTMLYQAILASATTPDWVIRHFMLEQDQFNNNFAAHLLAHISLLHGAVPNNILPDSQYMFLGPAWSLSLEWQFYLIAPVWVWAIQRKPLLVVAITLVAAIAYKLFLSKVFSNPSFLPGAGLWFLLGIATRLAMPMAPRLEKYPFAIVLGFCGLAVLDKRLAVLSIWIAMVAYFLQPKMWAIVDSRFARAAGMRSYAVYIIHAPIMVIALFISWQYRLSGFASVLAVGAMAFVGTVVASEFIHRWIELPAIELGKAIGRQRPVLRSRPLTVE
ncbi:acyltransferase family protein [Bradyrhizobium canariense]|uniref:acyltransferase family protein n=1 Tax=Bradyrhizobium canariense TaxID=255045 RepID=UPI00142F7E86|nr:acyltransferase [Bradyrhizobium canariense]